MRIKNLVFTVFVHWGLVLAANEFVVAKTQPVAPTSNLKSAKKIKELACESLEIIVREALVNLDRSSIDMRVYLLDQLKDVFCGEDTVLINSSSRSERQAYLDLVQALEQDLHDFANRLDMRIDQLKKLNSKAGKLKGS